MTTSPIRPAERSDGLSLAEAVYDSLRTAILHGSYRPNQRLVETDIAEELGASRTPVREALQRLGSESLAIKGRHGWLVREFTLDEIREIYEVRTALESYAARLAAERATGKQLKALVSLIREQSRLSSQSRLTGPAVVDLNDRFHNAVIAAADNARLDKLVKANRTYYFNYQLASLYTAEQTTRSLEEHELLFEAIQARKPDRAESLTRDHINVALHLIEQRVS